MRYINLLIYLLTFTLTFWGGWLEGNLWGRGRATPLGLPLELSRLWKENEYNSKKQTFIGQLSLVDNAKCGNAASISR